MGRGSRFLKRLVALTVRIIPSTQPSAHLQARLHSICRPPSTTRRHGSFELKVRFSRVSQKARVTIQAAIGTQAKKWENGALQEVLSVRRSHIRTMTLRAGPCSTHETGFGRYTHPILSQSEEKVSDFVADLKSAPSKLLLWWLHRLSRPFDVMRHGSKPSFVQPLFNASRKPMILRGVKLTSG